jgi:peptide/nickel transport system permease protein
MFTEQHLSPLQISLKRLKQQRLGMAALWMLCALYLLAIFADFLAPYSYDNEERQNSFHPPTPIYVIDTQGKFHFSPFIYEYQFSFDQFQRKIYLPQQERIFPLKFFTRGDSYKFLGIFKTDIHFFGVDKPARIYLFGADSRGRDLFSRVLYGARVSLSIGLIGVAISFFLGALFGAISGYYAGWIDHLMMRFCEMMMMVPSFYLLLALRASFPPQMSSDQVYLLIVVILSFLGWAGLARVVRGQAIALKEKEFVLAARAIGQSDFKIILRHILPNVSSYLIIAAFLSIPGYILAESALSLLGLGIQDPQASWGNLLSEAMAIAEIRFHLWVLIPGLFIFITVAAFNILGDSLRDAFDPRQALKNEGR